MKQALARLWQQAKAFAKRHKVSVRAILISLAVVAVLALLIWLDYVFGWTDLGAYENPNYAEQPRFLWGKSVWDWLDLLLVPVVLAVAGLLFNRSERRAEREIAAKRAETDREIAADRAREATLQSYLDKMTELMLEKGLRASEPDAEVRDIARARTLTVLRMLDEVRKGLLLRFLHEAALIGWEPVVDLSEADLNRVNLCAADLSKANLGRAFLHEANLIEAILCEAILTKAILRGADLREADLCEATLDGANLHEADLRKANLSKAILVAAILSKADLRGTRLTKTGLSGTILSEADLTGADLTGANLQGADLRGAKVTEEQLAQARSLWGATMPDGTVHE
jgi:uncharacterized protein YjbI with pentapeptide repeats